MFFRILKKEFTHKIGINIILFIFMLMATIFVASSVNNIIVVLHATEYCMEKGKVGDIYVAEFEKEGEENLGDFLKKSADVTSYSKNEAILLSSSNIKSFGNQAGSNYKVTGSIFLQSQWKKNMLIFDSNGKPIHLKNGEIAISLDQVEKNHLKIGDKITLKYGNYTKTYLLKYATNDPAFGGDFMSIRRFLISDDDFSQWKQQGIDPFYNYNINTNQKEKLNQQMNRQQLNFITNIDKDMISFSYVVNLISAAVLIIVGICFILIAFLILRFTIVFTLQDDFKEIGIMQAIGIKYKTIQKIYLAKYIILISVAACIGCFLSIPTSNYMIDRVRKSMLMESAGANFNINIICSILVALFVLQMCALCTRKLKKITAMEAIRSGQMGERYYQKTLIHLAKSKFMPTPIFLALNDILSSCKKYVVLILTFSIGMLLIILPLNTITSLKSDEMIRNFVLDTKADFYITDIKKDLNETEAYDHDYAKKTLDQIKADFKQKGYEIRDNVMTFYTFSIYRDEPKDIYSVTTTVPVYSDNFYYQMTKGSAPKEKNEIAFSEKQAEKMHVKIGDTVHVMLNGTNQQFIITGFYQNYLNMGSSAALSEKVDVSNIKLSGIWTYQCYFKNHTFTKELNQQLKKEFTQYSIKDAQQVMAGQLGSTSNQLGELKKVILILIFAVNILITLLMTKIFILNEKGQIALLKNIGFSNFSVRMWQTTRMGIILCMSVFFGAVISIPLNTLALRPIFGMMGATHMVIAVNASEVYLKYPLFLLALVCITTYAATARIKNIDYMELNNQE